MRAIRRLSTTAQPYLLGLAVVAAVTGAAMLLHGRLALPSLALFYLLPVMIVSARAGLAPGLFTSLLAALCYNFFLLPPRFTFWVQGPDNVVTLLVLFTVAAVTSQLAARLRAEKVRAESRASASAALADFARMIAASRDEAETLRLATGMLARLLGARVAILLDLGEGIAPAAAAPEPPVFGAIDNAAASWTYDNGDRTGRGTRIMASADWMFAPLIAGGDRLGVIGIARDDASALAAEEDRLLFDGAVEQLAQSLGRARLAAHQAEMERLHQRDELRAALLSSLGHDLRTPLTVILGGLEALRRERLPSPTLDEVQAEAQRLERLVGNLLGMARVEAGAVKPAVEPVDLTDAVGAALSDLHPDRLGHRLDIAVPADLPLVRADPRLLHHVLINLIGNAQKYGGRGKPIGITAAMEGGSLILSVTDEGPGIPAGQEQEIFDRFTRLEGSDRVGGTGLGLAIVRGFAAAMGLEVSAANRIGGSGALFSLRFPADFVITPELRLAE
jgi:two-component system sensor histidine kinase KdpD